MPTYVYACNSCDAQFEQFQSFKDEPVRTCPACAGAVRRVFQPVGIVFKGSGWYITDSRKSSEARVPSSESSAKSDKSDAKNETKSDTKSTATSETKSDTKSETKSEKASAPAAAS